MTKYCKCGNLLIFKGGYVIASVKVSTYECYTCNRIYEQVEEEKLREVKNETV